MASEYTNGVLTIVFDDDVYATEYEDVLTDMEQDPSLGWILNQPKTISVKLVDLDRPTPRWDSATDTIYLDP